MKNFALLLLGLLTPLHLWAAQALKESTFTQVIKDVQVINRSTQAATPAKISALFNAPDLIKTGPDSLAELIAADKTITRVGANTVFSFEPAGRAMNLEQGSVLFHSPKGKGGGTIRSKGASAAVLGTTIVVTATSGGGFKAIVLEGKGQITLPNGSFRILNAGQVTFVLPGAQKFGPQVNINLQKLVENSRLVQGFEQELPSRPVIQEAIDRQVVQLNAGLAEDTRILLANQATEDSVAVVDSTIVQQATQQREDRLDIAKRTDLLVRPGLTTAGLASPTDYPAHLFLDNIPFDVPALGTLNFSGLVAQNLDIASIVTQVDFTPVLNQTDFNVVAEQNLSILSPNLLLTATPTSVASPKLATVRFAGRAGLTIASGATLSASHVGDVHFLSGAGMTLNNVNFDNTGGLIRLKAAQTLNLTSVGISRTPTIQLQGNDISLTGGSYSATSTVDVGASRDLTTATSPQLRANFINVNATRNAALTSPVFAGFSTLNVTANNNLAVANGSLTGVSGAATATLSATEALSFSGTVASVASISLSARTLNLSNVNFPAGTTVNLTSANGLLAPNPNTGAGSVPNHVNFIQNVNYNGNPAELFVGSTINLAARP